MNRSEFIRILRKELDRLPQDEIDAAVEYYEEYFDEAGPDKEAEIIKELGNPRKIANQIRSEYEVRKLDEEETSTTRKGLSAIWWVIIGICSAPVSIPVAIVLVALAVAGFAVAVAIVVSVFAAIIGAVVGAAGMIVLGAIAIPAAFSTAVLFIGGGLLGLAVSAAAGALAVIGLRKAVAAMVRAIRKRNDRKGTERKCEE